MFGLSINKIDDKTKRTGILIITFALLAGISLYLFVIRATKTAPEVRVNYSPGEYFTTNVKGSPKLLKSAIVLVVNAEGLETKLRYENARIRDTIIFILRDLTETEILDPGIQNILREKIIDALNERLGIDNFVEVLFNDFVIVN